MSEYASTATNCVDKVYVELPQMTTFHFGYTFHDFLPKFTITIQYCIEIALYIKAIN